MPILRELLHILNSYLLFSINRNIYCTHLPLYKYISAWHSQRVGISLLIWLKEHFCQRTKLGSRCSYYVLIWSKILALQVYLMENSWFVWQVVEFGQVWDTYLVYSLPQVKLSHHDFTSIPMRSLWTFSDFICYVSWSILERPALPSCA